ncbi:hypothetical protein B0T16DRAFT_496147 [Cercophora newfieldiana]|uniref:Uncharacterized protein n=1 Tax=Cercophora newfieldiana TaxID=92897 RepID=A0AA39XY04_9PEZI|nr:hypothetical protein B0T16DRAFT_496147 [Cercophora newfieldiana]
MDWISFESRSLSFAQIQPHIFLDLRHPSSPRPIYAMEPISAISLVGDIIGLIDSGLRTVEVARRIYQSATGSTADNENLAFVANEVRKRAMMLQAKNQSLTTPDDSEGAVPEEMPSEDEKSLYSIAQKCRHISEELLSLLATLQATQRKSVKHSMLAT